MLKRSLITGMVALLLTGFTATTADAGEARGRRGSVVVEDEAGRKARRPATRKPESRKPEARKPEVRPGSATRPNVERTRPSASWEKATRPAPRAKTTRPESRVVVAPSRGRHFDRLHPRPLPRPVVRRPVQRWVPGHYEERVSRVWVPGRYRTEKVPARYKVRKGLLGIHWRILIAPERTRKVWTEGHYRMQRESVWVPGHWVRLRHPAARHR